MQLCVVLQRDEFLDRAEIVAKRQVAGRLHARKDEWFEAAHFNVPEAGGGPRRRAGSGREVRLRRAYGRPPAAVQVGFGGFRAAVVRASMARSMPPVASASPK
jgi:hypothetical protein